MSGAHRTEAGEWALGWPSLFQDHPGWYFVFRVSKLKHPLVQGWKTVGSHDGHWAQETGCSSWLAGPWLPQVKLIVPSSVPQGLREQRSHKQGMNTGAFHPTGRLRLPMPMSSVGAEGSLQFPASVRQPCQ